MRFSILTLLGLVAIAAVGCAALANANPIWSSVVYISAVVMSATSLLGSLILRRGQQAFAIGFAAFGISFFILCVLLGDSTGEFSAIDKLLGTLHAAIKTEIQVTDTAPFPTVVTVSLPREIYFEEVGKRLGVIVCGLFGGFLGRYFYWLRQKQEAEIAQQSR